MSLPPNTEPTATSQNPAPDSRVADATKPAEAVGTDIVDGAAEVGAATTNGISDTLSSFGDFFTGFFENTSGWGIAGMAGGAFLAWTIGNAFGGGGLLGMIISIMLMPLMAKLGGDFAEGSLAPAVEAQHADGRSPERAAAPATAIESPETYAMNDAAQAAAKAAAATVQLNPADFSWNGSGHPTIPQPAAVRYR